MQQKDLRENIEFVEKNRDKLLQEYYNKYLLVYHKEIIDTFDTYEKAAKEGVRKFGMAENFLVYHLMKSDPLNFVSNAAL